MDVATDDQSWQVLLIRGLKPNVDENTLAKGLEKLYLDDSDQPGAKPQTLRRVFVIRDRVTDRSLGYGFAEYHSLADAKAALAKAQKLGTSCTISSKQIEVCHPHLGVFGPVLDHSLEEQKYVFDFKQQPRKYHDKRYYASPHMVNEEPPAPPQGSLPVKEGPATNVKPKKRTKAEAMGTLDNPSEPTKKVKKESAMVTMLNRAQAHARGEEGEAEAHNDSNPKPTSLEYSGPTAKANQQSFAFDGEHKGKHLSCCFLCNTSFSKPGTLERHVQHHAGHAEKYKDQEKFQQGLQRMKNRGIAEDSTLKVETVVPKTEEEEKQAAPEYRDRAAERREIEARARVSVSLKDVAATAARKKQQTQPHTKPPSPSPPPGPPAPAPKVTGIGLRMLQKAGWTEGQGLGGSGTGITAPIEQNVYAAGVGLGHEGSKVGDAVEEADRLTRATGGDFVEKTREGARRRFEGLG